MFAFVYEAELSEYAHESPAFAPLSARPPNKTPEEQTTVIFLLKVIACSACSHRNPARESVPFLYLLQNVLYFA